MFVFEIVVYLFYFYSISSFLFYLNCPKLFSLICYQPLLTDCVSNLSVQFSLTLLHFSSLTCSFLSESTLLLSSVLRDEGHFHLISKRVCSIHGEQLGGYIPLAGIFLHSNSSKGYFLANGYLHLLFGHRMFAF